MDNTSAGETPVEPSVRPLSAKACRLLDWLQRSQDGMLLESQAVAMSTDQATDTPQQVPAVGGSA